MRIDQINSDVHVGELYGKVSATGLPSTVYHVLAVNKQGILLQNMDNPLSQFETTQAKLKQSGYIKLSETPYVNLAVSQKRKTKSTTLKRCPYTFDIFANRADYERPHSAPLTP